MKKHSFAYRILSGKDFFHRLANFPFRDFCQETEPPHVYANNGYLIPGQFSAGGQNSAVAAKHHGHFMYFFLCKIS
jgi:hypothetical protein